MLQQERIIEFKKNAWQSNEMAAWYAQRVAGKEGASRLLNRIEVGHIARSVQGRDILDIGIGTGRASLPLARQGYRIAGMDNSAAMLEECRRAFAEEGQTAQLRTGDLFAPPYAAESFDSIVSLSVLTHFPNWQEAVAAWLPLLRPAGRIVFDVYSLDHVDAFASASGTSRECMLEAVGAHDPARFNNRISRQQLADFCFAQGLKIVALLPYGGVMGGEQNLWLTRSFWTHGSFWERLKEYLACDDAFFEVFASIEEDIFARLSVLASGRFFAVLEKLSAPETNAAFLATQRRLDEALAQASLEEICEHAGIDFAAWVGKIAPHLSRGRARLGLFWLLATLQRWRPELAEACVDRLPTPFREDLRHKLKADLADLRDRAFTRGWHQGSSLFSRDVPLGEVLEYPLMRLLVQHAA